jgi:hypothetical protein
MLKSFLFFVFTIKQWTIHVHTYSLHSRSTLLLCRGKKGRRGDTFVRHFENVRRPRRVIITRMECTNGIGWNGARRYHESLLLPGRWFIASQEIILYVEETPSPPPPPPLPPAGSGGASRNGKNKNKRRVHETRRVSSGRLARNTNAGEPFSIRLRATKVKPRIRMLERHRCYYCSTAVLDLFVVATPCNVTKI